MIKVSIDNASFKYGCFSLWIEKIDEKTGKIYVAKPIDLIFEEVKSGDLKQNGTLTFDRYEGAQFLTELSEELIRMGFRDKVISQNGEIKRLENHLADMQKIAFKFIEKY